MKLKISMSPFALPLVFSIFALLPMAHASEVDVSGTWRLHETRCTAGVKFPGFEVRPSEYATYSFDSETGEARMHEHHLSCDSWETGSFTLNSDKLRIQNVKSVKSNCIYRSSGEPEDSVISVRQLPSGETALVITGLPGEGCTDNGIGELILTHIPLG